MSTYTKLQVLVATMTILAACNLEKINETSTSLSASFSLSQTVLYEDCTIKFNNTSTAASSYSWDFGDGGTSTQPSPEHVYNNPGSYTVRLIANSTGATMDTSAQITVFAKTIFNKSYFPGTGRTDGKSVISLTDGGYVVAGELLVTGQPEKAYLFKTDGNGTVSWSQSYGAGNYQTANFVTQLADGNLLVVGTISGAIGSIGEDVLLIKTDINGNKLWERNFGTTAGNDDYGNSAVQLPNGNFVIVGTSNNDHLVIGCDQNGNKVWEKLIDKNSQDFLTSVLVTADNKILVSGISGTGNDNNFYLAKLDPGNNGAVIWENSYGGNGYEERGKLIKLSDGNYLLSGSSNSTGSTKGFLVKVNADGNKLWEKHIGQDAFGYAATESMDGGFVITGFSYQLCATGQCPDIYIAKTDATGNVIWEKGILGDNGYDIKSTPDCGYVIVGSTQTGAYLVKTDMDGNFQ
jgi:PKD repeat protein